MTSHTVLWRRRSRAGHYGQSLVELAIVVPVLVLVFLGVWTAADLSNAKETVDQAVRAGARLAAEIGNNGYVPGGARQGCQSGSNTDPCLVDGQIVRSVLAVLANQLSHAAVTEIDVYQPALCPTGSTWGSGCPPDNGAYVAGDLIDQYNPDGSVKSGSPQSYTLDKRIQIHPNESPIGVRVLFHYTSPGLRMFTSNQSAYAVIRLAPVFV